MGKTKRILDVGQCGVDGPRIMRYLQREFDCAVDNANTRDEALDRAGRTTYDLVLVNRILNQDRSPGLDVIAALHKAHPGLKLMLVSDYPEAQEEAARHGALPGFGKSELGSPETSELIASVLNGA